MVTRSSASRNSAQLHPQGAATSQPQAGSMTSQPQVGSAAHPLSQQLFFLQLNSFFSKPKGFLPPQQLSQAGASQPQVGAQATSHPQAGSGAQQGAATSQPQAGSTSQQLSHPQPRCLPNSLASNPPCFLPHPLSQQGSTISHPHAGSAAHPQGAATSHPHAGSQATSQPHAGSAAQPVSHPLLQSLSNRPNALASAEVLATSAKANKAGTITRRIVILHEFDWKGLASAFTAFESVVVTCAGEHLPDRVLLIRSSLADTTVWFAVLAGTKRTDKVASKLRATLAIDLPPMFPPAFLEEFPTKPQSGVRSQRLVRP